MERQESSSCIKQCALISVAMDIKLLKDAQFAASTNKYASFILNKSYDVVYYNLSASHYFKPVNEAIKSISIDLLLDASNPEVEHVKFVLSRIKEGYRSFTADWYPNKKVTIQPIKYKSHTCTVQKGNNENEFFYTYSIYEHEMNEQSSELELIFSQFIFPVLIVDSLGLVEYMNPAAEKLIGFNSFELKSKSFVDLIGYKERLHYLLRFNSYLKYSQDVTSRISDDLHLITKQGDKVFLNVDVSIIKATNDWKFLIQLKSAHTHFEANDQLVGLAEELQNENEVLTKRIYAQDIGVHNLNLQYLNIFQNNPQPMWIYDSDTLQFLAVNEQAILLYGYSRDEFQQMTLYDIRPAADIDKLKLISKEERNDPVNRFKGIWTHVKKNGTAIKVEIFAHSIVYENRNVRMAMINDVTERLRTEQLLWASEQKFRTLIEKSTDYIITLNAEYFVTYASPSFYKLAQDNKLETKKRFIDTVYIDDVKNLTDVLQNLQSGQDASQDILFRYVLPNSKIIWIEGTVSNLLSDIVLNSYVLNCRDCTLQIEEANERKEIEQRFRNTLDNMIEGVQIVGYDKKYIYVNDAYAKQVGIPKVELIGRNILEVMPDMFNNKIYKLAEECLELRKTLSIENRFQFTDGKTVYYQLSIQPVPEGIFILSIDITERVTSANALKFEQSKLNSIAAAAPGLIFTVEMDATGKLTMPYGNSAVEDIFGYPLSLLKDDTSVLFERVHPDDVKMVSEEIMRSANELTAWKVEHRYNHPVKGWVWHEGSSVPVKLANGVLAWHGVIIDITERKKVEEDLYKSFDENQKLTQRLFAILNTLPANIALLNCDGVILDVNNSWLERKEKNCQIIGRFKPGDNYLEVRNPVTTNYTSDNLIAKGLKKVLDGKLKEFVFEHHCTKAVDRKWFRMIAIPISEKGVDGLVVMHVDITQIKLLESEKLQTQKEEQLKITKAILNAQEKERNEIGIELHDNVNQILVGTNMLLSMINKNPGKFDELLPKCIQNLHMAVSENRRISHELVSPNNITETLPQQINRLSHSIMHNMGIKLHLSEVYYNEMLLQDDQKITIYRIAQEQFTNILKHAQANNVNVQLACSSNKFMMTISDDGIGMNDEMFKSGVGLNNIRNRLSIHYGAMHVKTAPGKGFGLTVEIPLTVGK